MVAPAGTVSSGGTRGRRGSAIRVRGRGRSSRRTSIVRAPERGARRRRARASPRRRGRTAPRLPDRWRRRCRCRSRRGRPGSCGRGRSPATPRAASNANRSVRRARTASSRTRRRGPDRGRAPGATGGWRRRRVRSRRSPGSRRCCASSCAPRVRWRRSRPPSRRSAGDRISRSCCGPGSRPSPTSPTPTAASDSPRAAASMARASHAWRSGSGRELSSTWPPGSNVTRLPAGSGSQSATAAHTSRNGARRRSSSSVTASHSTSIPTQRPGAGPPAGGSKPRSAMNCRAWSVVRARVRAGTGYRCPKCAATQSVSRTAPRWRCRVRACRMGLPPGSGSAAAWPGRSGRVRLGVGAGRSSRETPVGVRVFRPQGLRQRSAGGWTVSGDVSGMFRDRRRRE